MARAMFTGLVECTGRLAARSARGPSARLTVEAPLESFVLGESIAVNGACLTVTDFSQGRFEVDVTSETLERTTLGRLALGAELNLERSLKVGDHLGGHLVSGHVDGVARVVESSASGDARVLVVEAPEALAPFIAAKGSVALEGISLTVNRVAERRFWLMLIPHTLNVTTAKRWNVGSELNLEIDLVARYVVRYLEASRAAEDPESNLRAALERANLL